MAQGHTLRYIELQRAKRAAEKARLDKVTLEEDAVTYLNHWEKTEIKVITLPTDIVARLNHYAMEVHKKNGCTSSQMKRQGNNYVIEFKREGVPFETHIIKTNGQDIQSIEVVQMPNT